MVGFRMVVDDVFWLSGRPGPVAMGREHSGVAHVGDRLRLTAPDGTSRAVVLRSVEFVCRVGDARTEDPPLNLLLGDGLSRDDVQPGFVLEGAPSDDA